MLNLSASETIPVAPLRLLVMESCQELGSAVDKRILAARREKTLQSGLTALGYQENTYLLKHSCPRFGTGEAKAQLLESVRGTDLFIITDITNHRLHYKMHGESSIQSPDDHFQDLKRVISACMGQTHRINLILPFLYESRQHRRTQAESLDCAIALQELSKMGVDNIITFDVHDPRVQNAIPIQGFDNFYTSFQFIRALLDTVPDIRTDKDHLMVINPNESNLSSILYYATVMGVNMGMFYRKRNYSIEISSDSPVMEYTYLGSSVEGKDLLLIEDTISSGNGILAVARELRKQKAGRIFIASTFGLFTNGLSLFDEAYENGVFDHIFTTNLVNGIDGLSQKPYYHCVDLSKYLALIIDTLNHDTSVNEILNPLVKIHELLEEHRLSKA